MSDGKATSPSLTHRSYVCVPQQVDPCAEDPREHIHPFGQLRLPNVLGQSCVAPNARQEFVPNVHYLVVKR